MKITCSKRIIKADSAEDMRQQYRDRRKAAHAKKLAYDLNEVKNADDKLDAAFDKWVPAEGPADSLGGELIRAMMRLIYRDWNDGDVFYDGYGIETCADAACFIWDNGPKEVSDIIERIGENHYEESDYSDALKEAGDKLVDAIISDPDKYLTNQPGEYDYQNGEGKEWVVDLDYVPEYELDVSIPYEVMRHIEVGDISDNDLVWELQSWDMVGDAEISISNDTIYLTEMDKDHYEQCNDNGLYIALENYGSELTDEYGDPDEEDEDEEYDEDEEA